MNSLSSHRSTSSSRNGRKSGELRRTTLIKSHSNSSTYSNLGNSNLGNSNLGNSNLGNSNLGNSNLGISILGNSNLGNSNLVNSSMTSFGSNSEKIARIKQQARSKIDTGLPHKPGHWASTQESHNLLNNRNNLLITTDTGIIATDAGRLATEAGIIATDADIIATDSLFTNDDNTVNNSESSCLTPNPLESESDEVNLPMYL